MTLNPKEPEENLRQKARLAGVRVAYSAFHCSFEAFSEEGGLRMAPPPKPPLLV